MTSLPLFGRARMSETGYMSSANTPSTGSISSGRRSWRQLLRSAALSIAAVIAECHRATGTMMRLSQAPDRYLPDSGHAPGDYAEFLFRTSGPLLREPAADRRRRGELVR